MYTSAATWHPEAEQALGELKKYQLNLVSESILWHLTVNQGEETQESHTSNHSEYVLESFILCSIVQGSRENVGEPEKVQEASMRHGLEPCQIICCHTQCR